MYVGRNCLAMAAVEIVYDDDRMAGGPEVFDRVRSDVTGSTGDESSHACIENRKLRVMGRWSFRCSDEIGFPTSAIQYLASRSVQQLDCQKASYEKDRKDDAESIKVLVDELKRLGADPPEQGGDKIKT